MVYKGNNPKPWAHRKQFKPRPPKFPLLYEFTKREPYVKGQRRRPWSPFVSEAYFETEESKEWLKLRKEWRLKNRSKLTRYVSQAELKQINRKRAERKKEAHIRQQLNNQRFLEEKKRISAQEKAQSDAAAEKIRNEIVLLFEGEADLPFERSMVDDLSHEELNEVYTELKRQFPSPLIPNSHYYIKQFTDHKRFFVRELNLVEDDDFSKEEALNKSYRDRGKARKHDKMVKTEPVRYKNPDLEDPTNKYHYWIESMQNEKGFKEKRGPFKQFYSRAGGWSFTDFGYKVLCKARWELVKRLINQVRRKRLLVQEKRRREALEKRRREALEKRRRARLIRLKRYLRKHILKPLDRLQGAPYLQNHHARIMGFPIKLAEARQNRNQFFENVCSLNRRIRYLAKWWGRTVYKVLHASAIKKSSVFRKWSHSGQQPKTDWRRSSQTIDSVALSRKLAPFLIFFATRFLALSFNLKRIYAYVKGGVQAFQRSPKILFPLASALPFPYLAPRDGFKFFRKIFSKKRKDPFWRRNFIKHFVDRRWGGSPKEKPHLFKKYKDRKAYYMRKTAMENFLHNLGSLRRKSLYFMKVGLGIKFEARPPLNRLLEVKRFYQTPRLYFRHFKLFSPIILRVAKNRYRIGRELLSFIRELIPQNSELRNDLRFGSEEFFKFKKLIRNLPLRYLSRGYSILPFLGKASDGDYRRFFKYPALPKNERLYLSEKTQDKLAQPIYNYWTATHYPRIIRDGTGFFDRLLDFTPDPTDQVDARNINMGLFLSPLALTRSAQPVPPLNQANEPSFFTRISAIPLVYSHRIMENIPFKIYHRYHKDWKVGRKNVYKFFTNHPKSRNLQRRIFELAEFADPKERPYRSQYGHLFGLRPRSENAAFIARRFLQLFRGTRIGGLAEEGVDPDLELDKEESLTELLGHRYSRLFQGRYNGFVKYLNQRSFFRHMNPPKLYWAVDTFLYTGHLAKNLLRRYKTIRNFKLNVRTRAADEIFRGINSVFDIPSALLRKFRLILSGIRYRRPFPKKLSFSAWCRVQKKFLIKPRNPTFLELDRWKTKIEKTVFRKHLRVKRIGRIVSRILFPLKTYISAQIQKKKIRSKRFFPLLTFRLQQLSTLLFDLKLFSRGKSFSFLSILKNLELKDCLKLFKYFKRRLTILLYKIIIRRLRYMSYLVYLGTRVETRFKSSFLNENEVLPFDERIEKVASVFHRFRTKIANRLLRRKLSRRPMLVVNTAKNNVFLTVTDYVGRVLTRVSGGSIDYMGSKFEGKKRSTAHATYQSTMVLIRWLAKRRIRKIQLFFKCPRDYHTREVIRALENLPEGVRLAVSRVHFRFRYPFSHGARPKRKRYV